MPLSALRASGTLMQLLNVLQEKHPEKTRDELEADIFTVFKEKAGIGQDTTLKFFLDEFEKEIGTHHYTTLASNPYLGELFQSWHRDFVRARFTAAAQAIVDMTEGAVEIDDILSMLTAYIQG